MTKPEYHMVSFSGGKDSTAMLLHMMELGMQIDEVLYCDTGMEFPAMERHVKRIKKLVEYAGIKFVTLKNPKSFKYLMLEYQPILFSVDNHLSLDDFQVRFSSE